MSTGEPQPASRVGENTRQERATGSVTAIAGLLPPRADTDHISLGAPDRHWTTFTEDQVRDAETFILKSGIVEFLDGRRSGVMKEEAAKKDSVHRSGRPPILTHRAILVALQLLAADHRPLLMTEIRDVLCHRLMPDCRSRLEVRLPLPPAPNAPHAEREKWDMSTYRATDRAFHRLLDSVDPSIHPKGKKRTWAEVRDLQRDLTVDEQTERSAALDWICNQYLETALAYLPAGTMDRLQAKPKSKGLAYCIDGTPLPLWARGRGKTNTIASADPDGGIWSHDGNHGEPEADSASARDGGGTSRPSTRRAGKQTIFARELHVLTLTEISHKQRLYLPAGLPIAFTSDRPGVDPAGAARRLFANLLNRGHQPGYLAGDILYTHQKSHKFQTPAREAGFDLVLGYGKKHLGDQGAHSSGMRLVEGRYLAPCVPEELVQATIALREKSITLQQYKAMIEARVMYRMRTKTKPGPDRNERLQCPAEGPAATAVCAIKPKSEEERKTRQPDGSLQDLRKEIDHSIVGPTGQRPHVCESSAVTLVRPTTDDTDLTDAQVHANRAAKYRQDLWFGSDEHTDLYKRLRQSQEAMHGIAKNTAAGALDVPGRRRVMGWAANDLFAAILLAQSSIERIQSFLKNAQIDEHGHPYVARSSPTPSEDFSLPGLAPIQPATTITNEGEPEQAA